MDRLGYKSLLELENLTTKERQEMRISDPELNEPEINSRLQGTERNPKVMRSLCHNLVITKTKNRVAVRGNIIDCPGAVEQWTLDLRVEKSVQLEGCDVVELYKKGSFSYPLAF